MTEFELWIATLLAKEYDNHDIPSSDTQSNEDDDEDDRGNEAEEREEEEAPDPEERIRPVQRSASFQSTVEDRHLIDNAEWQRVKRALDIQKSKAFWREPRDLLVTLVGQSIKC